MNAFPGPNCGEQRANQQRCYTDVRTGQAVDAQLNILMQKPSVFCLFMNVPGRGVGMIFLTAVDFSFKMFFFV